jgi:hypothetical protein
MTTDSDNITTIITKVIIAAKIFNLFFCKDRNSGIVDGLRAACLALLSYISSRAGILLRLLLIIRFVITAPAINTTMRITATATSSMLNSYHFL